MLLMQREENDKKSRRGNPQEGWQITKAQLEGAGLSLPPGVRTMAYFAFFGSFFNSLDVHV